MSNHSSGTLSSMDYSRRRERAVSHAVICGQRKTVHGHTHALALAASKRRSWLCINGMPCSQVSESAQEGACCGDQACILPEQYSMLTHALALAASKRRSWLCINGMRYSLD